MITSVWYIDGYVTQRSGNVNRYATIFMNLSSLPTVTLTMSGRRLRRHAVPGHRRSVRPKHGQLEAGRGADVSALGPRVSRVLPARGAAGGVRRARRRAAPPPAPRPPHYSTGDLLRRPLR